MTEGTRWLKRSIDYLGNIRERLGDLAGYDTLANELIQNAEDARATRIVFNLSDVALTVDNDARFSDCGLVGDQRECPSEKQHKPSCDWHNLTWIAAGQKRGREETIGKFGVGFLAVYQITDLPTIVSGRHWELHEEKEEAERIKEVCRSGCGHFPNVDGTRFVFPYATDPESRLRRQLGQQLLDWRAPDQLQEALVRAAPQALLFMRHLTKVEIRRDGTIAFAVERLAEAGKSMTTQLIVAGNAEETWYLLDGDFDDRAAELKQEFGAERIEPVRHARVRLAVPGSGTTNGVLYTGLPTATATGLPFHIDSTFFPSSDRKRVIADSADYRTLWNQAAMEAAGHALAQHVPDLRQPLGHAGYWGLINGVGASRASAAESRLVASGNFWSLLAERVRTTESAYDSTGRWVTPSAAPVLLRAEEADSLPALDAIGLHPMHEDVRKIVAAGQLVMKDLGTHWLTADAVVGAIRAVGLVSRRGAEWAPGNLGTVSGLTVLWTEIEALLAAAVAQNRSTDAAENDLRQCAIALTTDAQLIPLQEVHRADPKTRQLLEAIGADVPLLHAEMDSGDGRLLRLCPSIDVSSIVAAIEKLGGDELQGRWESNQYDPSALLDWLAPRLGELDEDPRLVERLRALPLFPAGRELGSLSQLAIPGDFQDPLGLADVISLPNLSRHRQTLIALRVRELTIGEFARVQVPRAFRGGDLEPSLIRRVVNVLAARTASEALDRPWPQPGAGGRGSSRGSRPLDRARHAAGQANGSRVLPPATS